MKFVFHIDEVSKWMVLLGSVGNTVRYLKENNLPVVIDIVVNSEAIQCLASNIAETKGLLSDFEWLLAEGVNLVACQNALNASGLAKDDLVAGSQVVPASMIHLAIRQKEGYAYIRP